MTAGNIPRLIETLKTQAGDEKRLACAEASRSRATSTCPWPKSAAPATSWASRWCSASSAAS